jgi:hypothetical protein
MALHEAAASWYEASHACTQVLPGSKARWDFAAAVVAGFQARGAWAKALVADRDMARTSAASTMRRPVEHLSSSGRGGRIRVGLARVAASVRFEIHCPAAGQVL